MENKIENKQKENMKAYTVEDRYDPLFCTVVFAETRGKAKVIAQHTDACEDLDFTDIRAVRIPIFDKFYKGKSEMDWNDCEDRMILVRYGNYECSYEIDDVYLECDSCSAKEWCDRYERMHTEIKDFDDISNEESKFPIEDRIMDELFAETE